MNMGYLRSVVDKYFFLNKKHLQENKNTFKKIKTPSRFLKP
jgi:hypothetical protein